MKRRPLAAAGLALLAAVVALATFACAPEDDPAAQRAKAVAKATKTTRATNPAAWKRKVLLLGFDSCDPDIVEDMIKRGRLPNFARMRRDGAWGLLESTPPLLSPVVWTTIATGMTPERHGILDFVTKGPGGRPVPVSSRMRTADTMWEILARQGEQVGVVGWLVTYPADPLPNAFVVTDRMGQLAFEYDRALPTEGAQRTLPEELTAEIEAKDRVTIDDLPLSEVRPFANVTEQEYAAAYSPKFHQTNRLGNLRLILATAKTFRNAGERLYAEKRPRFFACYFEGMDALSHLFMPFAPPKAPQIPEDEYTRYKSAIEADYAWHDQVLGEFMALADEDTTLFVVSDHGFKSGGTRRSDSSDFHAKSGAMWHRPFGVIYAWGNGIAQKKRVIGAKTHDVAPTILAAMGYPKSEEMPGKVLTDLFEGGLAHESVPTYFGDTRKTTVAEHNQKDSEQVAGSPEEQAQMEKLRSLGYIGGERSETSQSQLTLGNRYLATGRPRDALELFLKLWETDKTEAVASSVAAAYMLLGEPDKGQEWAEKALGMDPAALQAQLVLTRIHMRRNDLPLAQAVLEQALALNPEFPIVHSLSAELHEMLAGQAEKAGDFEKARHEREEAIEAYRRALRWETNDAATRAALAGLLLTRPPGEKIAIIDAEKAKEALEHFEAALALRPQSALWHNNRSIAVLQLGVVAQNQGRADEAHDLLTQAVASADKAIETWRQNSGKEYAKAWANRGYALWKLGRIDDAAESAAKAREADPRYVFNAVFLLALEEAGKKMPPPEPAPKDEATK